MKSMKQALQRNPAAIRGVSNWRAGYHLLGGGIAWVLHLLLAYIVSEFGCLRGWEEIQFLGLSVVAWLLLFVSLGALALAGAATIASWRSAGRDGGEETGEAGADAKAFSARFGMLTNPFFGFIILVESIPIFYYFQAC